MRVLIAEDSVRLAEAWSEALRKEHYIADLVRDGRQGYESASLGIYDIVVLERQLPLMDGYEVLRCLRRDRNKVPVLIVSSKPELEDKLEGFRLGADDCMIKPFDLRELVMRIQAIVRRCGPVGFVEMQADNLRMDMGACMLVNTDSGRSLKIAGKEMQLMELLLRNQGQVLEREQIATRIWGYESDAEYNNVEVYISFVRRKLKCLQVGARIRSVRGVGYLLETDR